ncbi:uncharacterized protein DC041_0007467 [Schistosoma bovis]|uniref:Uncharacterized protein n=1 Tax=Schistosoma bovis TaxID=6184 RepID=A0A430Q5M6_SCHBO|nr:uncharacterized protein DC041_0007467 [Schistosoma bovis]
MPTKSLFPIHIIDPTYKDINEYAKDYDYDLRGVPISKWILIINYPLIYLKYYLENYSFLSYSLPVIILLIFYILMNLVESINCLYYKMKIAREWKKFTDKHYRPVSTENKPEDINLKRSKQSHEQCKEDTSNVTEGQQKEDLIDPVLTCLPYHMRKLLTITTENDKVSNEINTESIDEKIQLQEIESQGWINEYISRVRVAMKQATKYQKIKSYPYEEWNSLVCYNEDGNDQNEDNDHKDDKNNEKQNPLLEFQFKGTGESHGKLSDTREQNSLAPISHKKRNKRYQSKQRLMKFNKPLYLTTEQALFKDSGQVSNLHSLSYRQNSYHYYSRHHKRHKRSEKEI